VDGVWRTPEGKLRAQQHFQMITGTLGTGILAEPVKENKLVGTRIRANAGGGEYRGRVSGDSIEGAVSTSRGMRPWRASR